MSAWRARISVFVLAVACGGKPPPQQKVIGHQTASTPGPSCSDVGVILRGSVERGEQAARAREAAISNACEIDRWSPELVACITGKPHPDRCLDQLTDKQRTDAIMRGIAGKRLTYRRTRIQAEEAGAV